MDSSIKRSRASRAKRQLEIVRQVTERDYQIFKSLWKWKMLSTRAIAAKFFPEATSYSAYIRLLRMKTAGYLDFVQIDRPGYGVWTLSPKSFRIIRSKMVELSKSGFKSETPDHDYLATAFHLGEWLVAQPEGTHTFSEQQLRRVPSDIWPEWIPRSDLHRPDGYSLCNSRAGKSVIAFETEISSKGTDRYQRHVTYYDAETTIRFVFWLVDSAGRLNSIRKSFAKHGVRNWSKHHFILLKDFNACGWSARFIEGEFKRHSLIDILGYNGATLPLHRGCSCSALKLLDIQKRPRESKTSTPDQKPPIHD